MTLLEWATSTESGWAGLVVLLGLGAVVSWIFQPVENHLRAQHERRLSARTRVKMERRRAVKRALDNEEARHERREEGRRR